MSQRLLPAVLFVIAAGYVAVRPMHKPRVAASVGLFTTRQGRSSPA